MEGTIMLHRSSIGAVTLAAALSMAITCAVAVEDPQYPHWAGQWLRAPDGGVPRYDPSKPLRAQDAPLTPDYRALHEASIADLAAGGLGLDRAYRCIPQGMPRQMSGVS